MRRPLLAGLLSLVAACGPASRPARSRHEWRFYTYFVTSSRPAAINRAFAQDVFESSRGRLRIEVFTAGELPFAPTDVIKAVATNKVQMGDTAVGFAAGDVPELDVFSLPFVCTSHAGFTRTLPYIEPIIERRMAEKFGIQTLMNWTMPPQNIWTVDRVRSLGELAGKKVRAWNPLQVTLLRRLSAAAVSLAGAEVPAALQRKVIDAAITSALSVSDWKIVDSLAGGLVTNLTMSHQFTLVNRDALDALPEDLQALLAEKARHYQARFATEIARADALARDALETQGFVLTELSGEEARGAAALMAPVAEAWAKENGPIARDLLALVRTHCGT